MVRLPAASWSREGAGALLAVLALLQLGCGSGDKVPFLDYGESGDGDGGIRPIKLDAGSPEVAPDAASGRGDDDGASGGSEEADGGGNPGPNDGGWLTPPDPSEIDIDPFRSGLDAGRALDNLTAGEVAALCEAISDYQKEALPREIAEPALCFLMVLFLAPADVDECRAQVETCLSEGEFTEEPGECQATVEALRECRATVKEFEACTTESAAMGRWFFELLDCQLLDEVSADQIPADRESLPTPACDALEAECPELFDSGDAAAR